MHVLKPVPIISDRPWQTGECILSCNMPFSCVCSPKRSLVHASLMQVPHGSRDDRGQGKTCSQRHIMQKKLCKVYAKLMQSLCKVYAKSMQSLCKEFAPITCCGTASAVCNPRRASASLGAPAASARTAVARCRWPMPTTCQSWPCTGEPASGRCTTGCPCCTRCWTRCR